jgi:hypothetical protein
MNFDAAIGTVPRYMVRKLFLNISTVN